MRILMDELKMDWDYIPKNSDNRIQGRLTVSEITRLVPEFDVNCIILASNKIFSGTILDISASGIGVKIHHAFSYFKPNDEIKLKFNINKKIFTIRGNIVRIDLNNLGIYFIDPKETDKEYLKGLFLSYALQYKTRG